MRLYMSGTVSTGEKAKVMPTEIFFARKNCEDNLTPSKECLMLEGVYCECETENNEWHSRWKGVRVANEIDYEEEITAKKIFEIIKDRKLYLQNMNAYIDFQDKKDVYVKVTAIQIEEADKTFKICEDLLEEEIEFVM